MLFSRSMLRWVETGFSTTTRTFQDSISRWRRPDLSFSLLSGWALSSLYRPLDLGFSFVDSVVWSMVTVLESIALVSMLCFFFLCFGCTL